MTRSVPHGHPERHRVETVATVRRVPVSKAAEDEFGPFDYADAFEMRTVETDLRSAAEWLRAGLEGSPRALRWLIVVVHRSVLRLRLDTRSGSGYVLGWRVTKLDQHHTELEASGPLIHGLLVGRRPDAHTVRIDTFIEFKSRRAAAIVWTFVGPVHRRVAPYLLRRTASERSGGR